MSEHQHAIAVDLGGTHIRVAIVNEAGELTHRSAMATESQRGPRAVIERIANLVQTVAENAGVGPDVPVGVASPGPLNPRTGVVLYTPNLPGWRDVPFVPWLAELTSRRVAINNDGNCAALGERRFGSAQGVDNLIYLALGTGIGGGVISEGVLIDGVRGLGAEVGHTLVALDGPRCSCGNVGCLEAFTSGWAIKREAEAVATTRDGDRMRELAGDGELHAGIVAQAAREGNPAAMLILERAGRALGAAMGSFVNLFNPQMLVIGGGVATIGDVLVEAAKRELPAHCFADMRDDLTIAYSSLGGDTGMYGAAALAFSQFQDEPVARH